MIEKVYWILLAALAIYRLGRMIPGGEEGPFGLVAPIVDWALINQKRLLARGLLCFFCQSFWMALFAAAIIPIQYDSPTEFILIWLSINSISILVWKKGN